MKHVTEIVDDALATVGFYAREAAALLPRYEQLQEQLRTRDRMLKVNGDVIDILYDALFHIGGPEAEAAIKKAKLRERNEGPL